MRDDFVRALTELAAEDPRVMLLTGDLGFGVLDDFAARFPAQFVNAGVSEQNMTAMAAGLALEGHKVYTYSIANFSTLRCLEQIRNDVCYHEADVTVVAVGGGFSYGQLGMSHFATEDLAILRALPGMRVMAPTTPSEAYAVTRALAQLGGPSYLRLDKSGDNTLPADPAFALGKARWARTGSDATLVATGGILGEAMLAADRLAELGIAAGVVAVHSVKPLDAAMVAQAIEAAPVLVTVEEHTVIGGLGAAVLEACESLGRFPRVMRRVGLRDEYPTIVGEQAFLREAYGLSAGAIVEAVASALARAPQVPPA
jgi:transketolase